MIMIVFKSLIYNLLKSFIHTYYKISKWGEDGEMISPHGDSPSHLHPH